MGFAYVICMNLIYKINLFLFVLGFRIVTYANSPTCDEFLKTTSVSVSSVAKYFTWPLPFIDGGGDYIPSNLMLARLIKIASDRGISAEELRTQIDSLVPTQDRNSIVQDKSLDPYVSAMESGIQVVDVSTLESVKSYFAWPLPFIDGGGDYIPSNLMLARLIKIASDRGITAEELRTQIDSLISGQDLDSISGDEKLEPYIRALEKGV